MLRRIIRKLKSIVRQNLPQAALSPLNAILSRFRKMPVVVEGVDQGNYFGQVISNYWPIGNPFFYYTEIVDRVSRLERLRIVPLSDLFQSANYDSRPVISFRHDIDADPLTAIRCARYLARLGLPGSFYLLHTARYYGQFSGGIFIRNPLLKDWVRRLIVTGCEIGVHNDALGVYLNYGLNGAAVLANEIRWLKSQGAAIKGTVAHNSSPVYGAENSEIFKGRVLWKRKVWKNGRRLPVGEVYEDDLGLTYEGTYVKPKKNIDTRAARQFVADVESSSLSSEEWVRKFLCDNPILDYAIDYQFWLIGQDKWVVAGKELFEWHVNLERVIELLAGLPEKSRSVVVMHPEYFNVDEKLVPGYEAQ